MKQNRPIVDKVEQDGLSHVAGYIARLAKPSSSGSLLFITPRQGKGVEVMRETYHLYIQVRVNLVPSGRKVELPSGLFFNLYRLYRFIFARKLNLAAPVAEPEKEQAVRKLFVELNIAPNEDSVRDVDGYADAVRCLRYPIRNNVDQATRIVQRLLCEIYYVQESDGLTFVFMDFNNLDLGAWTEQDYKRTAQDCKRAIAIDPDDVQARESLAYIYLQQRRYAEAEQEYNRVLAVDPGDEYARYKLAWLASIEARRKRKQLRKQNIRKPSNE